MRLTGSRAYYRPSPPKLPPGLVELMEGLSKDVLKHNPSDIYGFCASHMRQLLDKRDGPSLKKSISLEQKIARAQEKLRQKADIRRQEYDKKFGLTQKNNKSMNELNVNRTLQDSEAVTKTDNLKHDLPSLTGNDSINIVSNPIHEEQTLRDSGEIEFSHDSSSLGFKPTDDVENNDKNEIVDENNASENDNELTAKRCQSSKDQSKEARDNSGNETLTADVETADKEVIQRNISDISQQEEIVIHEDQAEITLQKLEPTQSELKKSVSLDCFGNNSTKNTQVERVIDVKVSEQMSVIEPIGSEDNLTETCTSELLHEKKCSDNDTNVIQNVTLPCKNDDGFDSNSLQTGDRVEPPHKTDELQVSDQIDDIDEPNIRSKDVVPDGNMKGSNADNSRELIPDIDFVKEFNDNGNDHQNTILNLGNLDHKADLILTSTEAVNNEQAPSIELREIDVNKDNTTLVMESAVNKTRKIDDDLGSATSHPESITSFSNVIEANETDSNKELTSSNLDNKDNGFIAEVTDNIDKNKTDNEDTGDKQILNLQDNNQFENRGSNMDLETAAVTIQKVFRNFLFKSRGSTFEDGANEDDNFNDEDDKNKAEINNLIANSLNADRRAHGISRMDTVLQTVNEEKSLSLSTDDSSTISSAATIIQAHVRGFLVRNKYNSNKTMSSASLAASNSNEPSYTSLEVGNEQNKSKNVLNIHIVPEGESYLSRDESLITSMDLSLDSSPPSSVNLHPLGYDKSERRKLKREDAIQSISPPSNNSGKLSEDFDSVKELPNGGHEIVENILGDKSKENNKDVLTDNASTVTNLNDDDSHNNVDNGERNIESPEANLKRKSLTKMNSDEMDVVTPFLSNEDLTSSNLTHSGEFHDAVLPTRVSRSDTSVVSEFKNVLVYFLLWNHS